MLLAGCMLLPGCRALRADATRCQGGAGGVATQERGSVPETVLSSLYDG